MRLPLLQVYPGHAYARRGGRRCYDSYLWYRPHEVGLVWAN